MSSGLTNDLPTPGDTYKHQNGVEYTIDLLARVDNDDQDLLVVATGPDGISWARKIGNFMGLKDGKPRFVKTGRIDTKVSLEVKGPGIRVVSLLEEIPIGKELRVMIGDGTSLHVRRS